MRKLYLLLLLLPSALLAHNEQASHLIRSHTGPKIWLLSYPRSGNTWIRYCLEYTTGRASWHHIYLKPINCPIGWMLNFPIDTQKNPLWKVHSKEEMSVFGKRYNPHKDYLILIIRNPKEAITRHENRIPDYELLKGTTSNMYTKSSCYFGNLYLYDQWDKDKRLLIRYEDLLVDLRPQLEKILNFLGDSTDCLEEFFATYQEHRDRMIELYCQNEGGGSQSRGAAALYHSNAIPPDTRKQIDSWIAELYPEIWQAYLKDFYAEEVLAAG